MNKYYVPRFFLALRMYSKVSLNFDGSPHKNQETRRASPFLIPIISIIPIEILDILRPVEYNGSGD